MPQPLRFLFVEDIPGDHELAERQLRGDGLEFSSLRVEDQDAFLKALDDFQPDVIISDYSMPEFDGMRALKLAMKLRPDIPFIVLTGSRNEEIAVKCIKAGASDYVIKEHANRLPFAVREALKQQQERKDKEQTEEQLRASEHYLRTILQTTADGFWMVNTGGKLTDVNQAYCRLSGYTRDELLESSINDIDASENVTETMARIKQVITNGAEVFETRHRRKDGSVFDVEVSVTYLGMDGGKFIVFCRDITERKQAEQALQNARLLLASSLNSQKGVIFFSIDHQYRYLYFNKAHSDVMKFAYNRDIKLGMNILDCITSDDDRIVAKENYDRALMGESHSNVRIFGDVELAYYESIFNPIVNDKNEIIGATGLARDISERKQAEQALEENMRLSKILMDAFPCVALLLRPSTREIIASNQAAVAVGAVPGTHCFSTWGQRETPCPWCLAPSLWATGKAQHLEVEALGIVWDAHWIPVSADLYMHYAFDITERKRVEQTLKETNDKLTRAQRVAHIGSWEDYLPTGELHWSEETYHILGFPPNTPINMAEAGRVFPPEEEARFQQAMNMTINANVPYSMDYKIVRLDGSVRHIHDEGEVIRDEHGLALWMFGTTQDITDRKQTEEALRNAHWRLGSIIEGAHVGTWEWNVQTGESVFNEVWAQMIGYTLDELAPISIKTWEMAAHPDDLKQSGELLGRHFAGELPYYDCECRMKHKDGHWVWVHDRGLVITRTADGKPLMMFGTHTDITARKQSEEALRASLAEKVVLLKEVHHRVKNNLASILSLISLQQEMLTDPAVIDEFTELSGRIHSMALVHTLLYQSETLTRIDMHDYFETLLSRLRITHHPAAVIDLNVAAQGVEMDLDNAIPCGLIVTELVTNAFKFAFPDGGPRPGEQKCKVEVTAEWDGTSYTLAVSDNGVGFPAGLDWQTTKTLGLQLVVLLGQRQLDGQIELEQSGGTTFRLRFMPWK